MRRHDRTYRIESVSNIRPRTSHKCEICNSSSERCDSLRCRHAASPAAMSLYVTSSFLRGKIAHGARADSRSKSPVLSRARAEKTVSIEDTDSARTASGRTDRTGGGGRGPYCRSCGSWRTTVRLLLLQVDGNARAPDRVIYSAGTAVW